MKNKHWSQDEVSYLINNYKILSYKDIALQLNRSEGAIRAKCFSLNLIKNDSWSQDEIKFLTDNYYKIPVKDLANIMNRTINAIRLKAKKLGLKKYPYQCNYHFFKQIDTEEKAYWLGFLSADGWISKNEKTGAGVVGVELQYRDINHLKKLNKSLNGNYKITDRWRDCSLSSSDKKHHMSVLRIFSIDMYNDLFKMGLGNNKSYSLQLPNISDNLLRHYMRGYFDGDGCFGISYDKLGNIKKYSCSYLSASKELIYAFERVIHNMGITSTHIHTYKKDNFSQMWRIWINDGNNQGRLKFLEYLYKDSKNYLNRKYEKYKIIKNHIESQRLHQLEITGSFIV